MKRYPQGILLSCEIPWDDREHLLEDVFREEVRKAQDLGFRNIYVFGTAGEGYAVDTARFRRIVDIFYEETRAPETRPQVGVIGLSVANIVERLQYAYNVGFRAFQISLPCWGALNDTEVLRFFQDVCGSLPDASFLHYNLPRAKRVLTPSDYRRIVDVVPNLAATKNTGTNVDSTRELIRATPELQHFLGEAMFPIGCLHGECSLLSSFGVMIPSKTKEFFEYGRARQFDKVFTLLADYLSMVSDVLGPTAGEARIDGAYDKILVRLGGIDMPLRLLSPYECFPEEVFEQCRRVFEDKYPDWIG
jgi:dihydrodipicolinate synthase/N-acetylneuraminate lyase